MEELNPSPQGATDSQLDALPVVKYDKTDSTMKELPACAICLEEFSAQEKLARLPCKHFFHAKCIKDWLVLNATCPNCRAPIANDEKDHSAEDGILEQDDEDEDFEADTL